MEKLEGGGGPVATGCAGAREPIVSAEAAAWAGIAAIAAFMGVEDPVGAPERTAGAAERSCPGSVRQQEAAFRVGPFPESVMQLPQRSSGDGIFMPQLMAAAWQGARPAATNARRATAPTIRLMILSSLATGG